MKYELKCVDDTLLQVEEKNEIERQIDSIIERHKGNRYQINRLVFESTAALTASENLIQKKASQGFLRRFWNNLTGKNNRLQADIDRNIARAQYASQQTLQKLAEQNLMSFELITAVNNKLNASMIAVEEEINNVYGTMKDICDTMQQFFRRSRADIMQLATRIERLEKNVDLLNWQNSIEYQMYDGIEYQELDDVKKIVCIAHDFYNITGGEWRTSDLLLLKTAMGTIGLDPKDKIKYEKFIQEVGKDKRLFYHLIENKTLVDELATENELLATCLNQMNNLCFEEKYIIESVSKMLKRNNINISIDGLSYQMVREYIAEEGISLGTDVSLYELELELLYNIEQLNYAKIDYEKLKKAKSLYINCRIAEALPLLKELAAEDNAQARFMLKEIYRLNLSNEDLSDYNTILKHNIDDYPCSAVQGVIDGVIDLNQLSLYKDKILKLCEKGDAIARYEIAKYYLNPWHFEKDEIDYIMAMKYLELSALSGYFLAYNGIALRYYFGEGVNEDNVEARKYFSISANMGYGRSLLFLGDIYYYGHGVDSDISQAVEWWKKAYDNFYSSEVSINEIARFYSKEGTGDNSEAFKWWNIGSEKGYPSCICNLGWSYRWGHGVEVDYHKAIECFKRASEIGNNGYAERNLGDMYINGNGVSYDRANARVWYEKAAELGDEDAKNWLNNNPS